MIRGASDEIHFIFRTILPNQDGLKKPDWFKHLARTLGFKPSRVRDLWYDENCKTQDWEILTIKTHLKKLQGEELLNSSLRNQSELEKSLQYHQHISREKLNGRSNKSFDRDAFSRTGKALS